MKARRGACLEGRQTACRRGRGVAEKLRTRIGRKLNGLAWRMGRPLRVVDVLMEVIGVVVEGESMVDLVMY